MKTTINLNEQEIKQAIIEYVKSKKGLDIKTVHLSYYSADFRDSRDYSYHSATASE